jgi:class 3 adenylate cyclase
MADAVLEAAFVGLQRASFAALVWDSDWRVVAVTDDALMILGGGLERVQPPLGRHLFSPEWVSFQESRPGGPTLASQRGAFRATGPMLSGTTPGGVARLRELVDPRLHDLLDGIVPDSTLSVVSARVEVNHGDRSIPIDVFSAPLFDEHGRWAGGMTITKPGLPGAILSMLALGDAALFERMLPLMRPARRPSAILFADLESSTPLARELSTQAYFALVRRLVVRADESIVQAGGIVGKHVGDGITAFFLAEQVGSESRAARACIEAARLLRQNAAGAAARSELEPQEVVLRMGLHWGTGAYIGRLLTSGRTEVTALGDEINEAARIEACATGGRILASKPLIERLEEEDATQLGLDPGRMRYTPLVALPTATEKARRDAPAVSVAEL